ncbi:MAG: GTPase [Candidatus Micrarchaeia archaeon]
MPYSERKFYSQLVELLRTADVAIEMVDARFPEETRIGKLERRFGKKILVVASKSDLIPKERRLPRFIYFSSRTREGAGEIISRARKIALENPYRKTKEGKIVVFGIPNVGKSSLINTLRKKYSAKTGFRAGLTKGPQWIRLSKDLMLCDTAGVYEIGENDKSLALKSALDVTEMDKPEQAAAELISKSFSLSPNPLLRHYGISSATDAEDVLEQIAKKRGLLKKQGVLNVTEAAKVLIRDFQKGKFVF